MKKSQTTVQPDVAAILNFLQICNGEGFQRMSDYRGQHDKAPSSIKTGNAIIRISRGFRPSNHDKYGYGDRRVIWLIQGEITKITPDTKGCGTLLLHVEKDSITTKCISPNESVISRTSMANARIHIPFDIVESITYIK